jgi:hypothetical protein
MSVGVCLTGLIDRNVVTKSYKGQYSWLSPVTPKWIINAAGRVTGTSYARTYILIHIAHFLIIPYEGKEADWLIMILATLQNCPPKQSLGEYQRINYETEPVHYHFARNCCVCSLVPRIITGPSRSADEYKNPLAVITGRTAPVTCWEEDSKKKHSKE